MSDKDQAGTPEQGPPGRSKALIVVLGLLAVLASGSAGAYFYFQQGQMPAKPEKAVAAEVVEDVAPPVIVPLEIFTANLQPADSEKYLQIGLALKFSGAAGGEGGAEAITPYISDIRNAVLSKMAELKPEDVTGNVAREQLRTSIKSAIEKVLPAPERKAFKDVLFTQFVVQ